MIVMRKKDCWPDIQQASLSFWIVYFMDVEYVRPPFSQFFNRRVYTQPIRGGRPELRILRQDNGWAVSGNVCLGPIGKSMATLREERQDRLKVALDPSDLS
jgi:hypothetical protein